MKYERLVCTRAQMALDGSESHVVVVVLAQITIVPDVYLRQISVTSF